MNEVSIEALRDAIHELHGCESRYVESILVTDSESTDIVWQGEVGVFDLIDHSEATRCYAWSHSVDDSTRRRLVAVLHSPPVDSPEVAVRMLINAGASVSSPAHIGELTRRYIGVNDRLTAFSASLFEKDEPVTQDELAEYHRLRQERDAVRQTYEQALQDISEERDRPD